MVLLEIQNPGLCVSNVGYVQFYFYLFPAVGYKDVRKEKAGLMPDQPTKYS